MPSRIADEPLRPFSQSPRPVRAAASGRPSTMTMMPLEISVASSGMITTGCSPRTPVGSFHRLIHSATRPARMPPIRPPRKPAPTVTETAPTTKPGAIPGRSAMA